MKYREQTFLIYRKLFAFLFLYSFIYLFNIQASFLPPSSSSPPSLSPLPSAPSILCTSPAFLCYSILPWILTYIWQLCIFSRRCLWPFCYHLGPYSSYWLSSLITRLYSHSLTTPLHALYWFHFNIQGCPTYLELT